MTLRGQEKRNLIRGALTPTPAIVLEAVDAALDAASQGVEGAVDRVLHAAVLLDRDIGRCAPCLDVLADRVAVIAAIGEQHFGVDVTAIRPCGRT